MKISVTLLNFDAAVTINSEFSLPGLRMPPTHIIYRRRKQGGGAISLLLL